MHRDAYARRPPTVAGQTRVALVLAAMAALAPGGEALAQAEDNPKAEAQQSAPGDAGQQPASATPETTPPPAEQNRPAPLPTIPVQVSEKAEPLPAPQKDAQATQLENIVVTSTKRAKSVREIPASIDALRGEDLERQGVQNVEDIARLVPGVNVTQPGDNAQRITIRGIAGQPSTNATTGVLFGDISFTDAYLPRVNLDPNPFDLRSVEVLKGPQGTLFGAGALNGAIRYVPQPPVLGQWETKYFVQYTKLSEGGLDPIFGAALNMPIGRDDHTALRLVGIHRKSPGWIDNLQTGVKDANVVDQNGVRAILGWAPGDGWSSQFTYAWQDTSSPDTTVADNANGNLVAANRPRGSPSHNVYHFGDLRLSYDFSWARFISETGYIHKSAENFFDATSRAPEVSGVSQPIIAQVDWSYSNTLSQEFRLQSLDDPNANWQWATGIFGWHQHLLYHLDLPVETAGIPLFPGVDLLGLTTADGKLSAATLQTNATVREYAYFFDVTRRLWSDWELSFGGRLYRTTSGGRADQEAALLVAVNQQPDKTIVGTLHEQGFNPKASLLWRATHDILTYVAASKGFRVGGVQPGYNPFGNPPPDFFKSDTLWNYEAGLRTQWLHNTLHFDVTGYFVQWKNPQTFQLAPSGVGTYLDNVGGAKGRGVEAAFQYRAPFGLLLNLAGAWNDTVTTKPFISAESNATQTVTVPPGTQWPFAPHWQTNTSIVQLLPIGNWIGSLGVSHLYLSRARNNLSNSQNFYVFGFQQWDAQIGLSNPAIRWLPELSLVGNNLTDVRGITNYWTNNSYVTDVTYIRPRAVTLRLSGHF